MTKRIFSLLLAMLLPAVVLAGVEFSMKIEYPEVLQYEALFVYITLYNDSDQPYVINADDKDNPSEITFNITMRGEIVGRFPCSQKIVSNLKVMPDETRKLMLDVSQWYDVGKMGKYVIQPVVTDRYDKAEGKKAFVDVVYGGLLAQVTQSAREQYRGMRSYKLLYWHRRGLEQLFLRVDDVDTDYNYCVVPLGTLIRVMKPTLKVDRKGNVETFHQCKPTTYLRTRFKSKYDEILFLDQKTLIDEVKASPLIRKGDKDSNSSSGKKR